MDPTRAKPGTLQGLEADRKAHPYFAEMSEWTMGIQVLASIAQRD